MIWIGIGSQTVAGLAALVVRNKLLTSARPRIFHVEYSTIGLISSDTNYHMIGRRSTTPGTGTAINFANPDSADPTDNNIGGRSAITVNPTLVANSTFQDIGLSPQATFDWVAYGARDEIILPAVADSGVAFIPLTIGGAATVQVECSLYE